jgi:site-specific DNA-cytosine methylase
MTKPLRWATAVPLIGGLTLAAKQVTGVDPVALISYTPFGENEKNAKHNFPTVPHYNLDDPNDVARFDLNEHKDLDFVNAVCPCAGLSMLSSGSPEQRAKQNRWMLETAEYMTTTLRPKVFWGENAPTLYTNRGAEIRSAFEKFATQNGYSVSFYHTDTIYHGIPQSRKRTFYFFWRDVDAPLMNYYKRPRKTLIEHLDEIPFGVKGHTQEDLDKAREQLFSNPYMQFLTDKFNGKGLDHMRQTLFEKGLHTMTLIRYMFVTDQWGEAKEYFAEHGMERQVREIERIKKKTEDGYGVWDGSMSLFRPDGDFSALIHRKLDSIHPREDRILTPRECMHLMGLPHDFELVTDSLNHICQNVPVCTGGDMTREVVAFLNGERQSSGAKFLYQSNFHERVDSQRSSLLTF